MDYFRSVERKTTEIDCAGTAPMYFAYSKKDGEARWGHRTPSKKEQILYKTTRGTKCQKNDNAKRYKQNNLFYGYKPHIIIDAETEISIAIEILPANTNDKKLFDQLYAKVKKIIVLQYQFKFLADVKAIIKNDNGTLIIAINGRGHYESETSKDSEYGRR